MSGSAAHKPIPASSWNLDVEPGQPVDIFGDRHIFERVDPDDAVTFRGPGGRDFMVEGEDGRPRKPFLKEVATLMAASDLIWRERPLSNEARRYARAQELDTAQARAMDPKSPFRAAILRRFDANPWSRSDASLEAFMKDALQDPKISAMEGAWQASPATVRTWLNERGTTGCRKVRDGISMKNRMPKIRKIGHPLEILFYHAARATNVRGSIKMNYEAYVTELAKINAGEELNRDFWIDPGEDPVQDPSA